MTGTASLRISIAAESRAGNDATRRFAVLAELLAKLPDRSAILDGEIAVPDKRGVTHLALLDAALRGAFKAAGRLPASRQD